MNAPIPFHRTQGICATLAAQRTQWNSHNVTQLTQVNATHPLQCNINNYICVDFSLEKKHENCDKKEKLVATCMMWKLLAHEIIIPVAAFLKEAPCPPLPICHVKSQFVLHLVMRDDDDQDHENYGGVIIVMMIKTMRRILYWRLQRVKQWWFET